MMHDETTISSECCNAPAIGEVIESQGRCSDCCEMAEFVEWIE